MSHVDSGSQGVEQLELPEEVVFVPTQEALAGHLGVERKSVQRWMKRPGCPGKGPNGFDVRAWKAFIERDGLGRKPAKGKIALEEEKLALANEKARLQNQKLRGESLEVDEVCQTTCDMINGFVLLLRQSVATIAEEVAGATVGEATKRIRHRLDETLGQLALGSWAQKKTFWSTVYARQHDLLATLGLGPGARPM